MLAECQAAGIPPPIFWDLTFREIFAVLRGQAIKIRRERQLAVFGAWHSEAFARSKKMPDLLQLLQKMEPARGPVSPRALRAGIIAVATAAGATVIHHKKRRKK